LDEYTVVLLAKETIGQIAFESFAYVEFRETTALEAYAADDAVAFREVSVNVDALMMMLDVARIVPVTSRVYVGLGLRIPTFPPPPWTMNDPPTTLGRSMLRDATPPRLRGP
jgi:hypothetical protein